MQRLSRSGRMFFAAPLAGLGLLVTGCVGIDVRVENQGSIVPTGRVLWQAVEPTGDDSDIFRASGLALEADVSYVEGKSLDSNGIRAAESAIVGRTAISGAGGIKAKAGIVDVKGTVRGGLQLGSYFRLEPMMGFQAISLDFRASSSAGQASATNQAAGLLWGLRAGVQPHRMVEIYGRVLNGILDGTSLRVDSAYTLQAEAGLRVAPIDMFSLFAGYRWSDYRFQIDKEQTDPRIGLDGPVIGMELRF